MKAEQSSPSGEHLHLLGLVDELRASLYPALLAGEPIVVAWPAVDGTVAYAAEPTHDPMEEYAKNPTPLNAYFSIGSMWHMIRYTEPDINNERDIQTFIINLSETGLTLEVIENLGRPPDSDVERIREWNVAADASYNLQRELGMSTATEADYASFENAIRDLRAYNDRTGLDRSFFDEISLDPAKWSRRRNRNWIGVTHEVYPEGVWFRVTTGEFDFCTKATDEDDALDKIEAEFDADRLGASRVIKASDELQLELEKRYGEYELVELIPGSLETWPEEDGFLTPAQQAALDEYTKHFRKI